MRDPVCDAKCGGKLVFLLSNMSMWGVPDYSVVQVISAQGFIHVSSPPLSVSMFRHLQKSRRRTFQKGLTTTNTALACFHMCYTHTPRSKPTLTGDRG